MRGSGVGGLRAMAARAARDGVTIARPLLGVAKREPVAACEAAGVAYARDPSNEDPRYARTRMGALAAGLAAEGLDAAALARLARRAARVEDALARQTDAAPLRLVETATARRPRCSLNRSRSFSGCSPRRSPKSAEGSQPGRPGKDRGAHGSLARALERGHPSAPTPGARASASARRASLRVEPEPPRRRKLACRRRSIAKIHQE